MLWQPELTETDGIKLLSHPDSQASREDVPMFTDTPHGFTDDKIIQAKDLNNNYFVNEQNPCFYTHFSLYT
jgi:hypothetical protein